MEADRATYTADGNNIRVIRVMLSVFSTFSVFNHGEYIGTVRIDPDSETTKWVWETPDDAGMLSGWTRSFDASVYRLAHAFPTLGDTREGPQCAACGDATCTAFDAHHTVTAR